jgi:lipopolysaccharide assembly outer membrane protein LptD (OstA)
MMLFSFCLYCVSTNYANTPLNYTVSDSVAVNSKDSLPSLTVADSISLPVSSSEINDEVTYEAADSIIYDIKARKMYLFNNSKIKYTDMKVDADQIDFDWNTMNLTAKEKIDSNGNKIGTPVYRQGEREYVSEKMMYNFKSKRGKVFNVVTKEGEGYLHGEEVKKDERDHWNVSHAKYTTCNNEHPHFYIASNKIKLIPDKLIISGPANFVFSDVATPFYLPFGMFPVKQGRASGLILPQQYLFAPVFTLKGMGYYWAVNNKLGVALTTDLAFNGSYGFQTAINYDVKYKGKGSIAAGVNRLVIGDLDDPKTPRPTTEFNFAWTHAQSPKAHPTFSFSSSVNFRTSNFFKNSLITDNRLTQALVSSNINFSKRFRGKPYSITFGLNGRQDLASRKVDIDLPNFNFYVPFSPFKSKIETAEKKWFEKINMTYSTVAQSILSTYDSLLFKRQASDNIKFGINHNLSVGWNTKIFKYLNLSLNSGLAERWYFDRMEKYWDGLAPDTIKIGAKDSIAFGKVLSRKERGFYSVHDFNISGAMNFNIYGLYNFNAKKLKAIRHSFNPQFVFRYQPDFSKPLWNYYRYVQSNSKGDSTLYSYYQNNIYGTPSIGQVAAIELTLNNNLAMKLLKIKDTANPVKKINLLDNFGVNLGYNFAADSIKMSLVNFFLRSTISNNFSLNFSLAFDPYKSDSNNIRTNTFYLESDKKLLRFTQTSLGVNFNIGSSQFTKKVNASSFGTNEEKQEVIQNYIMYYDFNSPWNFAATLDFSATQAKVKGIDTIIFRQNLNIVNFDFNLTPKWKIALNTGYDFTSSQIALTNIRIIRDLHCWELSFNYTPISGIAGQTYLIELRPKSSLLQDLKLTRSKTIIDSYFK